MTGDTTTGSNVVTGLSSTGGLAVGMGVSGPGIPARAEVATIVSSTSITLTVAATATGTGVNLVFSLFSTTQRQYDAVGNVVEVIDPLGHATQTVYDGLNRAIEVQYPNFTATSKTYTPANLVTSETDQAGSVTTHQYDAAARHTAIYQPDPVTGLKTANSPLTQMGYDAVGNMTSLINPLGNEWTYEYDVRNRRTEEIDPEVANAEESGSPLQHPTILTGYDGVGNVISKTDARGYVTMLEYDQANRLVETIYPAVPVYPSGSPVAATTLTGYDFDGNILTVTDEDGNATVNTYDALNRLTTTTTAPVPGTPDDNIVEQFGYDPVGNRTQVTDGKGLLTTFTYDGLNRLLTTTYDEGTAAATVVTESYDALNKVARTEGTGRVTQYGYDVLNRIASVDYESATVDNLSYGRDTVGNVLWVVHPNEAGSLRDVVYNYDRLNRQLSENSDGVTQTHSYDKAGNRLTTVYGGTNRTLGYGYDALNRETGISDSTSSLTTSYAYDLSGNIVQKSLANGTKELRSHDGRNRVSTLNNQTSGSVNIAGYGYGYDRAGNVMQVTESYPSGGLSNRTITNSYDGVYRLLTEAIATTGGSTVTTTYVYDKGHNRTSKAVSGGATTTYVIGDGSNGAGANQIVSATTGGVTTDYGYDANGNRVSRIVPTVTTTGNLTSGSVTITGVASTTGLAVGLVAGGTGLAAGATVVSVGSASATAAGNTTSGSTTVSGLAGTTGIVVGTQVSGTGIPFGATVISVGSSSVTLSAAATATGTGVSLVFTTLTVTLSSPATATGTGVALSFELGDLYGYDDENRLVNLNYQTGESGTGTYVYGYDYRTRRVARTEPGPVATHIVFDGGTSIIEYGTGGAARPNVEYVRGHDYGGGVGGLEYSVRSGTPLFNFYDSRGDVTTQTNGSGAVTFQTGYEAFGNQTVTTGSTPDRQKASTKEHDPTGLLNEGFRYRDPETGTFLTRDPLGFKAGPNMYCYVRQNPWTHFDPEGLDASSTTPTPPPPPPPTKKDNAGKSTANSPAPPPPTAQLDIPKLSLNMQSQDDKAAQAASDFGRTDKSMSSAPPAASAKTTQQQNAVPLKDDKGNVVKSADGTPALVPSTFDIKKVISAGQTDQALGWVSYPARALATAADLDKFNRGNTWDLQRLSGTFDSRFVDSATILIGMYAASAGIPKSAILSIENRIAKDGTYKPGTQMDPTYTHLPVRNVTNTITGMQLIQTGAIKAP
jgi:RHS repeat-associated protein